MGGRPNQKTEKIMKELVMNAVKYLGIGTLLMLGVLGTLTLFLAMPDILQWVAGYIGGVTTFCLFILAAIGTIALCVKKASN